jgi:hypothetical protein
MAGDRLVVTSPDDLAAAYHHRANGHLAGIPGLAREIERGAHESGVVIGIES